MTPERMCQIGHTSDSLNDLNSGYGSVRSPLLCQRPQGGEADRAFVVVESRPHKRSRHVSYLRIITYYQ